jgi:hypothetical protein
MIEQYVRRTPPIMSDREAFFLHMGMCKRYVDTIDGELREYYEWEPRLYNAIHTCGHYMQTVHRRIRYSAIVPSEGIYNFAGKPHDVDCFWCADYLLLKN